MKRIEHYTFGKASKRLIPQEYNVFKLKGSNTHYIVTNVIRKHTGCIFYLRKIEGGELSFDSFETSLYFLTDAFEPVINRISFYK